MKPSSFINFSRKVKGMNWNPIKIHRKFMKEVEKSDYQKSEVEELIQFLFNRSKSPV